MAISYASVMSGYALSKIRKIRKVRSEKKESPVWVAPFLGIPNRVVVAGAEWGPVARAEQADRFRVREQRTCR